MPMGQSGSPLTFQRTVNTIFEDVLGKGLCVYMDNIWIYIGTEPIEEHDALLKKVFQRLRAHSMEL